MTQFFVDASGNYLGGFDGAIPPEGAIEVPTPPEHGLQKWADGAWQPIPEVIPQILTPRQLRQSLTHYALRATVEGAVAAADQDTRDWYEFATQFERNHPRVIGMAQALGFTDAQVDAVWTYGASL